MKNYSFHKKRLKLITINRIHQSKRLKYDNKLLFLNGYKMHLTNKQKKYLLTLLIFAVAIRGCFFLLISGFAVIRLKNLRPLPTSNQYKRAQDVATSDVTTCQMLLRLCTVTRSKFIKK